MRSSRAGWLALLAVSINVFTAALDLTVMAAVLPGLIRDFGIPIPGGLADASWIVNGYLIAYVVTMPIMGKVSDLYGRRLVFLACLVLFSVGSVWAALTNGLWMMVAARVLQALGGGAMVPVALAAVSDAVSDRRRPLAIAAVVAVDTAGWVAGSAYGAWITTWLGWRWVFWLNLPAALLGIVLVAAALPRHERTQHRLDIPGAALLTVFLFAITMVLYLVAPASPEMGLLPSSAPVQRSPWFWPLAGVSIAALAGFIYQEKRTPEPVIDLRLLSERVFAAANGVSLLTGVILMSIMVEIPVLLQAVTGSVDEGTRMSGLLLGTFAAGMMVGAFAAGPIVRRVSVRLLTLLGLSGLVIALWRMSSWEFTHPPQTLLIPLFAAGLGLGFVTTPLATAVLERVREADRGIAASILLVARLSGMTIGLSVLVTWALRRFDALVAAVPPPPGGLFDPGAAAYIAEQAARVMTTVITDLFTATTIIGLLAIVPALFLQGGGRSTDRKMPDAADNGL
ncbi:MAG: MFS transporter [Gemmatimonadota bacterium]|nr:MFS transporter [Gemmatimonadota bacterium]